MLVIDGDVLPVNYLDVGKGAGNYHHHLVPTIIGVTRQEVDFSPGDIVANDTIAVFAAKLAAAVAPAYGIDFAAKLLALYDLHVENNDTLDNANTGARSSRAATRAASRVARSMQLVYANVLSDSEELCNNIALADVWAPRFAAAKQPLYMYAVSQRPGNPFCALTSFQSHPYCPTFSFHGIDMFALFGWLPPSRGGVIYNATAADRDFTALMRARFIEFAKSGRVESWREFRAGGAGGARARARERESEARTISTSRLLLTPPRNVTEGYWVVDLALGDDKREVFSGQGQESLNLAKCQHFLGRGFYDNKSWVN